MGNPLPFVPKPFVKISSTSWQKLSWKKSSTYFYILGHVVYAMSIRQIRQQHKEKKVGTQKNVALSSADVAALK